MKILNVDTLLGGVKVIRFGRFADHRGYFTEPFRASQLLSELGDAGSGLPVSEIVQTNESFSHKGVMRGLHFQWNPYMGKLVRTISGHMIDMFLDIRVQSATYGKIGMYDMPSHDSSPHDEWIWVPPGFAHGNFFIDATLIEYFCTGEYNPDCEAGISPLSPDLDWTDCDEDCKRLFSELLAGDPVISEKDKSAPTFSDWRQDQRSTNFTFGKC